MTLLQWAHKVGYAYFLCLSAIGSGSMFGGQNVGRRFRVMGTWIASKAKANFVQGCWSEVTLNTCLVKPSHEAGTICHDDGGSPSICGG